MNNLDRQDFLHLRSLQLCQETLGGCSRNTAYPCSELTGERCQNINVADMHPSATENCGCASVEGNPTTTLNCAPASSPASIKDAIKHGIIIFCMYHQNTRGVKTKVSELCLSWARACDIICHTEHWLPDETRWSGIPSVELVPTQQGKVLYFARPYIACPFTRLGDACECHFHNALPQHLKDDCEETF
ncbi:hypothetical protein J6590_067141 [Homalodisca vitripennis]|nr:hypothetical protein J6590_067141 [Homalodisca vitripennis]